MQKIEVHKVGLATGSFVGILHICWALLVAFGWAQGLINLIFKLHMITPLFKVSSFSFVTAIVLVGVTSAIGYIAGSISAVLWNKFVAV